MPQLFVEQLANVDFSYLCPDYGLVGETWLLDVCLQGKLDDQGMIFDFSNVKHEIKLVVEEFIDHKLLVPVNYEGLRVEKHLSSTEIWFTDRQQREIYCHSPTQGICEIDCMTINIAVVEQQLVTMVKKVLPANVTTIDLKLKIPETRHSYQYSHGLKKHEGACQHIAHGHRSDLKILNNKQISAEWENFWIEKLHRKYLADAKDIVKKHTKNNKLVYRFSYTASQGDYVLELGADQCYLIETETTVEYIAEHIFNQIISNDSVTDLSVRAYEGFHKGAIAS